jgi:hypothetical protein
MKDTVTSFSYCYTYVCYYNNRQVRLTIFDDDCLSLLPTTELPRHHTTAFDFQRYSTKWQLVQSIVFAVVALVNAVHALQGWWRWRQGAIESSKSVGTA